MVKTISLDDMSKLISNPCDSKLVKKLSKEQGIKAPWYLRGPNRTEYLSNMLFRRQYDNLNFDSGILMKEERLNSEDIAYIKESALNIGVRAPAYVFGSNKVLHLLNGLLKYYF